MVGETRRRRALAVLGDVRRDPEIRGILSPNCPFTDGYNMAERMAWMPHFLHKRESFHGQVFPGRAIGSKAG